MSGVVLLYPDRKLPDEHVVNIDAIVVMVMNLYLNAPTDLFTFILIVDRLSIASLVNLVHEGLDQGVIGDVGSNTTHHALCWFCHCIPENTFLYFSRHVIVSVE